jgi:predicted glycoside hydrolase/deacetylase ChbG (UPF0249 family)
MTERRLLIVNADDFGLSSGVNAAIIETHLHGILTSASLMVRPKNGSLAAAQEAAKWACEHPSLSLGLHIDLGEWHYMTDHWEALYEVVPLGDAEAVRAEVSRQLEQFHELAGKPPTHLDSHQHVHRDEPVRSVVLSVASDLNVPLRHFSSRIQYRGEFYGQSGHGEPWPEGVSVAALRNIIAGLSPGVTELGCHPSWDDDLQTMYCRERIIEAESLCDPRVRQALDEYGVELISFNSISFNGWL